MELFEKIYSSYYQVVRQILAEASTQPITQNRMRELSMQYGFFESSLSIVPKLASGQWPLLRETSSRSYHSILTHPEFLQPGALALTKLQKSWLKALLSDRRIRLFLSEEARLQAEHWLSDCEPLFCPEDFYYFDQYSDGDDYESAQYQEHFRMILQALNSHVPLHINYENSRKKRQTHIVLPYQLQYSAKDDKFRICGLCLRKHDFSQKIMLNLSRIDSCHLLLPAGNTPADASLRFHLTCPAPEPVTIQISGERNSLDRCMLHFANYEKHTRYDEEKKVWICSIYYDMADETELLIELLSFGPVIRVLGPESFLSQFRERVRRQHELFYTPLTPPSP